MATHFLPLSKKMCLAYLHMKANICAKFHENWWKTEEVVRDARFSPHFCHNMPLPWQHFFCHCRKMCLAHLHPKAHICAKFDENWSKTEEVVRDARLAPDRPTTHWFLYTQLYTTCMRGYNQEFYVLPWLPMIVKLPLISSFVQQGLDIVWCVLHWWDAVIF